MSYPSLHHARNLLLTMEAITITNNELSNLLPEIIEELELDEQEQVPRLMFNREQSGHRYVLDVLAGHPECAYNCFKLPPQAFV